MRDRLQEFGWHFFADVNNVDNSTYVGEINRWGVDIGKTENGQMSWLVLAPTEQEYSEGGLNGSYKGVSAEATVGVGAGANLMTGGSENTLALQPLSVNTQSGVNFAVGVGEICVTCVSEDGVQVVCSAGVHHGHKPFIFESIILLYYIP